MMRDNLNNELPYSAEAESGVLSILLQTPTLLVNVKDTIRDDDFFNQKFRSIYQAILRLSDANEPITTITVHKNILLKDKKISNINHEEIVELSNVLIGSENLDGLLSTIKDAALKRSIITLSDNLMKIGMHGEETAYELMNRAEEALYELSKRKTAGDFVTIPELTSELKEKIESFKSGKQKVSGLTTGFESLNYFTTGLHPEELIVIAARPGVGKSAFALNLAQKIAASGVGKQGTGVIAFFSLEMSNEQIMSRLLSNIASLDGTLLRSAKPLTGEQWSQFNRAQEDVNQLGIIFDDSGSSTINSIRAKCRKLSERQKLDLVIIDYLQLVRDDRKRYGNEQEEIAEVSKGLKQLARELKIPIIALSQLSRRIEHEKNAKPRLAFLRGSGSIEQDADIVMFLHANEPEQDDDEAQSAKPKENLSSEIEVIIAKNRQGMTGHCTFIFEKNHGRFSEKVEESLSQEV